MFILCSYFEFTLTIYHYTTMWTPQKAYLLVVPKSLVLLLWTKPPACFLACNIYLLFRTVFNPLTIWPASVSFRHVATCNLLQFTLWNKFDKHHFAKMQKFCTFTCQYFGPGALNAFYKKIQLFPRFAPEWPKMTYFIVSWSDTVDIVCFFSKPLKMAHIKLKWNCLEGCFTMIATLRQWILQELSRKIS